MRENRSADLISNRQVGDGGDKTMKRPSMICGLVAAAVSVPACVSSTAASPRSEAATRVRSLQQQVEENDRQIRDLEATLRRLQAKPAASDPSRSAVAPNPSRPGAVRTPSVVPVPSIGEISAWSTESPSGTPRQVVTPRPTISRPAPTTIVEE